ncbi:Bax inhibitor-1/YccA family protein [Dysgonomonas sp. 520]|uniref:Bax inhibitor-1/YccA family protein n=1 Tax=Dysgonomonas sp. 520 TaxID=2302931 RepID=UPI0013D8C291|nr:Bax inhibitor-1/YccA family protein [Dysgonomonas sp. 520]NDW08908.1 BAX inhibitor (BI)-1/YccA family protein [Dysgonomonas sp. 520]
MDFNTLSSKTQQQDTAVKAAQAVLFRNVYIWMTLALVITGLTAMYVASSPNLVNTVYSYQIVFLIATLALVWFLSAKINTLSFTTATICFVAYSVLIGFALSLIFLVYTDASIALTFFVTASTFAVMALIGTFTKKDLSSWGSILYMALIGLIIASVANWIIGSSTLYWIITYAGVIIFVGLTAYDAQKIKRAISEHGNEINESTQKIALMGALSLYLDFINLFLFLLRILGSRR